MLSNLPQFIACSVQTGEPHLFTIHSSASTNFRSYRSEMSDAGRAEKETCSCQTRPGDLVMPDPIG